MFGFGRYAIIVAVLLCIAAVIYAAAPLLRAQIPPPIEPPRSSLDQIPEPYRTLVLKIEREAIEQAFKQQVVRLFDGWVKDHQDQPARALRGIDQARDVFIQSMLAIDRREAELERK